MRLLLVLAVGLVAPAVGKGLSVASVPDASALTERAPSGGGDVKAPAGASNCGLEAFTEVDHKQHGKSSCADVEPSQQRCEDYYTRHPTKSDRYTLCKPMDATNKTCGPGLAFGCTWTRYHLGKDELQTRSQDSDSDPDSDSDSDPWTVPPGYEPYPDGEDGPPASYPMGVCPHGCIPEGTNPGGSNPNPSKLQAASDGDLTPGGFGDWPGGGTPIRAPTDDGAWDFCWCTTMDSPPTPPASPPPPSPSPHSPPPPPLPKPPPPLAPQPQPPMPRPPTIDVEWNDGSTLRGNANLQLLDDMFDACAAIAGPVNFPANSNSACSSSDPDCGSDGICKPCVNLAESHDTCNLNPDTFSQDADGTITSQFGASVQGARGGCCTANSCVGAYFESQPASLASGDKVYFDYQAFAGSDWFEVGVGLYLDDGTLIQAKVFRGKAMTSFTNDFFAMPAAGNYKLGFFVGSYDRSGGSALGATLKVKKFQMTGTPKA